jgi:hypothetical protein
MTETLDLTTATPAEVDTALSALYRQAFAAERHADQQYEEMRVWVGREVHGNSFRSPKASPAEVGHYFEVLEAKAAEGEERMSYTEDTLLRMRERWQAKRDEFLAAVDAQRPYHDEFERRGGWTRAFLVVTSGRGHVHKTRSCSTCNKMGKATEFHWLPEVSGHNEEEIVEQAGERACTVCYPSAPVEVLARPTQFFTPDEEANAKAREEREAKRVEKEAAKVTVTGVQGWTNEGRGVHIFPTVRGATNAIASNLSSLCWWGPDHPSASEWLNNVERIREALAVRGVEYDYDKALAAARKKVQREGGEAKF